MSDLQSGSRSSAPRLRTAHAQMAASVLALAFGFTFALGCSTNTSGLGMLDGGSPGTGGAAQSGGRSGAGGSIGTGGASGTGGRVGTGGATSTGGTSPGTGGGNPASGGSSGSGGSGTAGRAGTGGAGTGGVGAGGRAGTGGAGTGGGGAGGRVGTGGAGTGGRTGTGGAAMGGAGGVSSDAECMTAADCHLYSDCCNCLALPVGATLGSPCSLLCIQSKCSAQQVTADTVACVAGRCVAGFTCDDSKVTCKVATPNCPDGEVPGLNAEGTCYSGGCVPVTQCKSITDCSACSGDNNTCVRYSANRAGGDLFHCVTIPTACHGSGSCDCMGKSTCIAPVASCSDKSGQKGLVCSCPTC